MANSAFHKKQAEALIIKHNQAKDDVWSNEDTKGILALAQVHATLATVQDMEEE